MNHDRESLTSRLMTAGIGHDIHALASDLFPICRSITGDGVRETLRRMSAQIELDVRDVPSGTPVFDWTVPREWNIRGATIKDPHGRTVLDFADNNLHVMSYSIPVRAHMPLAELKRHLHTLPSQPDLIPYRTSYYQEAWGFCMSHRQLESLTDGNYDVTIDSTLADGSLTYGEYLHKGKSDREVLLSAHICHPSLANDNCSGLALLAHLANRLQGVATRLSYRFLFAPGTIGAITWLARNEAAARHIDHGLVISCVGDSGGPIYKKSRRGDAVIDRTMARVLTRDRTSQSASIQDFLPYGYDERQFCSPGFNLPVGLFQRSQYGTFPEYHTSADNLEFIQPEHLEQSYRIIVDTIDSLERDVSPAVAAAPSHPAQSLAPQVERTRASDPLSEATRLDSLFPKCEPQLGRRGLYGSLGGDKDAPARNMAMLWVLNLADGRHTLLDMAERAKLPYDLMRDTAARLIEHGLVVPSPQ